MAPIAATPAILMRGHGPLEVLAGLAILVVAAAFLVFAILHSGRSIGEGYTIYARFDHIDGLNVGSDVRIAGVRVGTVTDERIDLKYFRAVVSMTVREGLQIPNDTAAIITSEGLLGGKYVSLSPGGSETFLRPSQTIDITQSSISLEQLLGKFIFGVTSLNGSNGRQNGGRQGSDLPRLEQRN